MADRGLFEVEVSGEVADTNAVGGVADDGKDLKSYGVAEGLKC